MPLRKPEGLHRYPKLGGNNPANIINTSTPEKPSWKSQLTPGERITHEIAVVRQRLGDIERIQRDNHDQDGKPLNAQIRRLWHKGTRKKIKEVLALIRKYSGDKANFIRDLQELERQGLGGNELTESL